MKIDDSRIACSANGVVGAVSSLSCFAARLSVRDADGRLMPLLRGNESDAELRVLALSFVESCPTNCDQNQCPFRVLKSLYHVSLKALVNSMSHAGLVSLFEAGSHWRDCPLRQEQSPFMPANR